MEILHCLEKQQIHQHGQNLSQSEKSGFFFCFLNVQKNKNKKNPSPNRVHNKQISWWKVRVSELGKKGASTKVFVFPDKVSWVIFQQFQCIMWKDSGCTGKCIKDVCNLRALRQLCIRNPHAAVISNATWAQDCSLLHQKYHLKPPHTKKNLYMRIFSHLGYGLLWICN